MPTATTPKKIRKTIRVIASILMTDGNGWKRVNWFDLVSKEFTHAVALRKALGKTKTELMKMTDENTVEVRGPQAGDSETKTVFSVLRYSGQCPECGAMAGQFNEWCELCMSQTVDEGEVFDGNKALSELLGITIVETEQDEIDAAAE